MNGLESQTQEESLKKRWQQESRVVSMEDHRHRLHATASPAAFFSGGTNNIPNSDNSTGLIPRIEEGLVAGVVPAVTVVLEGRSICHRINLQMHASYRDLAMSLRQMFGCSGAEAAESEVNLSNAVPGHLVAYEDIEHDLLLAGDLDWKDFVRVAKRIRIVPVRARDSRRGKNASMEKYAGQV